MSESLRFLPVGLEAVLVELKDLETTLTLLDQLLAAPFAGMGDVVPAARTVMVEFDPLRVSYAQVLAHIARLDLSKRTIREGGLIEIPVAYTGEDLGDVAEILGWSIEEVIRRHTEATFSVAFTGFAPGFAYMTCDDAGFDLPRRASPRVRIPAGSVAMAGKFGGIYPSDSPGGWQLLGQTPLKMWDTSREKAALLAPGDTVVFRDLAKGATVPVTAVPAAVPAPAREGLVVIRADRPALFQDFGRPGKAGQGVSQSGALDRAALREANALVGNPAQTPVLEITFGGFGLKADRPVTLGLAGAPCPLVLKTIDGRKLTLPFGGAVALDAGESLTLETPLSGMRSYLSVQGGFAVDLVLGSAATDTLAKVGPMPVQHGDVVPLAGAKAQACALPSSPLALPKTGEEVVLDVVMGPRSDWFTAQGLATLTAQTWEVTSESNRVGMRLAGEMPLERVDPKLELPSEATATGAIQVPHSGQPVLFLADHPLTGGYPVIGTVASTHLDLAGQIPVGAKIRFNIIAPFAPVQSDEFKG